jgi:hypothetical protein
VPGRTVTPSQTITIVQEAPRASTEINVGDVLLGSVGVVFAVLIAGLLGGVFAGGFRILAQRLWPGNHINGQDADETSLHLGGN